MKKNFAIAGCGNISGRHAENITKQGILKAVCDVNFPRAQQLAKIYGGVPYPSLEDMLSDEKELDVITICTPNGLHAAQAIFCLDNNLDVLCEKPLCLKVEDANKMIEAALNSARQLFIVKQNRFNTPVLEVKNLLDNNALGKIFSFQINGFWNRSPEYYIDSWRGTKHLDGGILYTQFSHFIDLLCWLLGDVDSVEAKTSNYNHPAITIEDTVTALINLQSGAIGTMHFTNNSYEKNMEGSFTIFGENGTIKIGGKYLNTVEYANVRNKNFINKPQTVSANDYGFYKGSMSNHDKVYNELFKALNDEPHQLPDIYDAVKTVEIIEKIYASAAKYNCDK